MCGIGVLIAPAHAQHHQCQHDEAAILRGRWPSVLDNIHRRGPDCVNTVQHDFSASTASSSSVEPWLLSLTASVLSLRGDGVTAQPLTSSDGRLVLAWNGQIFDWDDLQPDSNRASSSRLRLDSGENDAIILFDRIQQLLEEHNNEARDDSCAAALSIALSQVEGPYSFVLLDRAQSKMYFGRDPLGRRSLLLYQAPQHSSIAIVSVASESLSSQLQSNASLIEVNCSSLWTIDLVRDPSLVQPLARLQSRFTSPLLLQELREPDIEATQSNITSAEVLQEFLTVLSDSVRKRVTNINTDQPADEARVAILFSGGLDCTTLALLADRHVPLEQPIDLLNVAFENVRAIEAAKQERQKRMHAKAKAQKHERAKRRQHGEDEAAQPLVQSEVANTDATDEIDSTTDIYLVPDRLTGHASYAELCRLCPHRRWNFIPINVPYVEYTSHRAVVSTLMSPTSSVMDLSIASALYFAACARGSLFHPDSAETTYTSPARVLLSGLGADELLGGYSRHRQAFTHHSLQGLVNELQLDLDRLPTRNLGRDDRVLSHYA